MKMKQMILILALPSSDTRWACQYESIRAIEANLPIVIDLLNFVIEDRSSLAKAISDSRGLIHQIRSFEFILQLAMVILKPLFEHTSKYLQSIQIDLARSSTFVCECHTFCFKRT